MYGAGLYSFFNNYSTTCSDQGNGEVCQNRIVSIEGTSSAITIYNENTGKWSFGPPDIATLTYVIVGVHYMITLSGKDVATYSDNLDGFVDTIALYRK